MVNGQKIGLRRTTLIRFFCLFTFLERRSTLSCGVRPSEFFLTDPVLEYFKQYAPIGARDRSTEKLLQDAGVESYFSGCMTLTLERPNVAKVDDLIVVNDVSHEVYEHLKRRSGKSLFRTSHVGYSAADQNDRFARARELLSLYARASCVVTARLHCALPCLAMGTPVLLIEAAADAYRFSGLWDLLYHCSADDFISGHFDYDVDNPPQNREDYKVFRENLIARVSAFTASNQRQSVVSRRFTDSDRDATIANVYEKTNRPRPKWRAIQNTFVKTQDVPSDNLDHKDKVPVRAGAVVSGYVFETRGGHLGISNLLVNGASAPLRSGFIYKPHWREI